MRKITMKLLTLILSISIFSPVLAVEIIDGGGAAGIFDQALTSKAFDRYDGTLYVGCGVANADLTIASAGRTATLFTGIGEATDLSNSNKFAIATSNGKAANYIGFSNSSDTGLASFKIQSTGAIGSTLIAFGDTVNTVNAAAAAATGLGPMAGGYFEQPTGTWLGTTTGAYFFVRTRTGAATNATDMANSNGIKAFKVTSATTVEGVGYGANQRSASYDGTSGDYGTPLKVNSATATLVVSVNNQVTDMYWDATLKTLFVSTTLLAPTVGAADCLTAITKVKFNNAAAGGTRLTTSDVTGWADGGITYANMIKPNGGNASTAIFTVSEVATADAANSPVIHKIRTMHTSTGKVYLIVNGGVGTATSGNKFSALRYSATEVLGTTPLDADPYLGSIVKNNTAGTTLDHHFTLTTLEGGNTGSLTIGGQAALWANTSAASDMEVVGDTVYVSYSGAVRSATVDPGIWASTAMFDKNGVIIGWTGWERVFTSDNTDVTDRTPFFSVDAYNNKLWHVNQPATTVRRHAWKTSDFTAGTLAREVDDIFEAATYKDCTCVLDLPAYTPGISPGRVAADLVSLALFGGYERVIFARTMYMAAGPIIATTQDFASADNFLDTTLPAGAGTVRSLGLARTALAETKGYFFAGTDLGLWVYATTADDHAGYNPSTQPTTLAAAPFDGTFSWIHMMDGTTSTTVDISGAVTAIDSDGTYMYVVEQDVSTIGGIVSKLWRITLHNDVERMERRTVIIAQSGSDGIPVNTLFTGFSLATNTSGTLAGHVGILSTNAGVLQSRVALSTLLAAGSNDANIWAGVDVSRAYTALKGIKRVPTTAVAGDGAGYRFVGTAFEDSTSASNYYQDSTLRLFGITAAEIGDSQQYNIDTDTDQEFDEDTATENRILSFWSDGGRRFTTRFNGPAKIAETTTDKVNMLWSLPYSPAQWNMTVPVANTDTDGQRVYWTENISGLGIILAGTTEGVIALQ